MNDLISQEEILAVFIQKDLIHGNLTLLEDSYDVSLSVYIFYQKIRVLTPDCLGLRPRSAKRHHGPSRQRKHRQHYGWAAGADRECR